MLKDYQKFAEEIALKAGKVMKSNFSMDIYTDWKSDGTPLTKTDTAINEMVIEEVGKRFPEHGLLGEEASSKDYKDKEYLWVCDPIDGTAPYSHGLNISTFSIALVRNGKPIVGVAYDPWQNLLFSATENSQTTMNGKTVNVSKTKEVKHNIIDVCGPVDYFSKISTVLYKKGALMTHNVNFIFGAKMVASGHFAASIFGWNKPWDCAAVKILVEQAGGKCTDYFGNDQRYDGELKGFVASNGLIHDELLQAIKQSGILDANKFGTDARL